MTPNERTTAPMSADAAPKGGRVAASVAGNLSVIPRVAEGGSAYPPYQSYSRAHTIDVIGEIGATACHLPPDPEGSTVVLTIRSEGSHGAPFEVRLRRCLKLMLRAFGLRVVSISQTAARGLP